MLTVEIKVYFAFYLPSLFLAHKNREFVPSVALTEVIQQCLLLVLILLQILRDH